MGDGMIQTAKELGGVVNQPQGTLYCKIPSQEGEGKFWIVGLNFTCSKELGECVKMAKAAKWLPFDDVINLKVSGSPLPDSGDDDKPSCPIHGTRYIEKSKKRPGSWYCQGKNGQRYCTWETD